MINNYGKGTLVDVREPYHQLGSPVIMIMKATRYEKHASNRPRHMCMTVLTVCMSCVIYSHVCCVAHAAGRALACLRLFSRQMAPQIVLRYSK